jgi:RHS repeat-associated protein
MSRAVNNIGGKMQVSYRFFAVALLIAISSISAIGQIQTPYDGFTQSGLQSGAVPASLPIDNFVQVNLATGSLRFSMPLLTLNGKGKAGYTIYFTMDNRFTISNERYLINCTPDGCIYGERYQVNQNYAWANRTPGFSPGFLVARHAGRDIGPGCPGAPTLYEQTLTHLTFVSSDDKEYEFVDSTYFGEVKSTFGDCSTGVNRGNIWVTRDGSSATFISDNPISDRVSYSMSYPSGTLKWKDGTTYKIINGWVREIIDTNGNKTSVYYDGDAVTQVTDSIGRVIRIGDGINGISFKGYGGSARSISFSSADPQLRPDYSAYHTHGSAFPFISDLQFPDTPISRSGPTRIILPNGQFYRLYYNPYGELARVDLPTGGKVEFDYVPAPGTHSGGEMAGASGIFRVIREKRVYKSTDDTTPVERMLFTFSVESPNHWAIVDRVDPMSPATILARTKHYFYGSPYHSMSSRADLLTYPAWNDNLEYKTEHYDAGGATLLRTVDRVFSLRTTINGVNFDPRLTSETVTLNDVNLVYKRTFSYDSYNNKTEVSEYGFGVEAPGPLLRRAHTDYVTVNNGVNYAADTNIHIRSLPLRTQVSDAGGIKRSETIYEYDNYNLDTFHAALGDCLNIIGHDGAFSTGYLTRGNLTRTSHSLLDKDGNATGSINSYAQYDIAGNVVKVIDGRTGITTFEFIDRFGSPNDEAQSNANIPELAGGVSYAFPTKVTNALLHEAYTQYDYYLGKPVNSQDANGVVSSVEYNDALDRPTQRIQARYVVGVGIPDVKRQMTITYDDANRVVTTSSDRDTFNDDTPLTSKSYYDGLGRTWRSAADEGSTWTITDTRFDALGRVSHVSNPYRATDPDSASPPADLWTTTEYDSLGRAVKVTTPDDAHVDTDYNGNQVTVTDQAGKQRHSETDALGRLIRVTEDPDNLNHETYYSYDTLNNLLMVTQGSQIRTFDYDSLSRLISATNPESGTISYVYDENGNLKEKTDARGVKTTMTYDALNRVKSKVYEGTPKGGTEVANATPPVTYFYDDYSTLPGGGPTWPTWSCGGQTLPNTPVKGRLIGVTYGTGSDGTYYRYDATGKIIGNLQRMGTPNFVTRYTYNLAGAVLEACRGYSSSTRAAVRNMSAYDDAGRLADMRTSFTPHTSSEYLLQNISYTPFGALQTEKYGNGLIHSIGYNKRLQPTEIRLGSPANPESVFTIYNLYGTAANPEVQDPEIELAQNNGNIARIKYVISGELQYSQTFQYDPLNRLKYAVEHENGVYNDDERAWHQTFEYDFAGNRGIDTLETSDNVDGLNTALRQTEFSKANNRITRSGYSYDAAGNLTQDPRGRYTYDGENRLVTAEVGGVATSQYVYDGNGRRVKKTVSGVGTRFEYGAGGELIAERNDAGVVTSWYYYRNGELLATSVNGTTHKYATSDHLGSPRAWTDDSGAVIAGGRHDYLPFGEELLAEIGTRTTGQGYAESDQQDGQRKQFGSKVRDIETRLDFFESRYYSSVQGRFTKPDTFGGRLTNPQTLNLYAYVLNNPLKWADPTGHAAQDPKNNGKDKCGINYDCTPDETYDPNSVLETIVTSEKSPGIGQPSTLGSIVPFYGSGRSSIDYFQTGHPYKGTLYAGLAISDIFLLKSLAVGGAKLGLKLFGKEAAEEATELIVKESLVESGIKIGDDAVGPTFINLGDDAAGTVLGNMSMGPGGYRLPNGALAEGSFDFVIQGGSMRVGSGHVALSQGAPVTYAGEVTFRGGAIVEWTNASGHFRPAAVFAGNAGLPLGGIFRPVQFPTMVGGSQFPIFR